MEISDHLRPASRTGWHQPDEAFPDFCESTTLKSWYNIKVLVNKDKWRPIAYHAARNDKYDVWIISASKTHAIYDRQ